MERKRKRPCSGTSAASDQDDRTLSSSIAFGGNGNPFDIFVRGESSASSSEIIEEENDGVFSTVIKFLDLSHKKSSDASASVQLVEIAQQLLEVLDDDGSGQSSPANGQHSLISTKDITGVLLPWAIKRMFRLSSSIPSQTHNQMNLEWQILDRCTAVLLTEGTSVPNSSVQHASTHLSLSNLRKLVPLAATSALHGQKNRASGGKVCPNAAMNCYCYWVRHFYRPSFDSVCDSLLPLFADYARDVSREAYSTMVMCNLYHEMVVVTLKLLRESMTNANPKKAFQSLIRPTTLSALSIIHSTLDETTQMLLKATLDDGLFDPEHHMDGFRSLQLVMPDFLDDNDLQDTDDVKNTDNDRHTGETKVITLGNSKPFHCYQEGLIANVNKSVSVPPRSETSVFTSVVRMIPLLLNGFIEQSNASQNQRIKAKEKAGKKKTSAKKIVQLQFLFFAHLVAPVMRSIRHLDCNVQTILSRTLLKSLDECFQLLLTHDVYLPSADDLGGKNYAFLQHVSHVLMQDLSSPTVGISRKRSTLPILATIMQLNHIIFHSQLAETISVCLTLKQDDASSYEEASEVNKFFGIMVSTYKKLRQLDHLFDALIVSISSLSDQQDVPSLLALSRLVQNPRVRLELTDAVQNSPIEQLKQVITRIKNWIESIPTSSRYGDGESVLDAATSLIVAIFGLLLTSVRIDATTAPDMSPLCTEIKSCAIDALVGPSKSIAELNLQARQGIKLCGWTIDLKNRCDFWLRNSREGETHDNFDMPDRISEILVEAIETVLSGSVATNTEALQELQFLACHRLQQLHAKTHEKQRVAFATDAEEFGLASDVQETRQLANFTVKALRFLGADNSDQVKRRWNTLMSVIASWAPYVHDEDMKWFLSCFFSRVIDESVSTDDFATWLLRDASFLEIDSVRANFSVAGYSFAARSVYRALAVSLSDTDKDMYHLACSPGSTDWRSLPANALDELLSKQPKKTTLHTSKSDAGKSLWRAASCLNLLNSVEGPIWGSCGDDVSAVTESCMRLDYLCYCMARSQRDCHSYDFAVVASIRALLLRVCEESRSKVHDSMKNVALLGYLFKSTIDLLSGLGGLETHATHLVESTKALVAHLLRRAHREGTLSSYARAITEIYSVDCSIMGEPHYFVLSSLGVPVVSIMSKLEARLADAGGNTVVEDVSDWGWKRAVSVIFSGDRADSHLRYASISFIASLLRNGNTQADNVRKRIQSMGPDLVNRVLGAVKNTAPDEELRSLGYLLAFFAAADLGNESRQFLFDNLACTSTRLPEIFQNALCELGGALSAHDMYESLTKLVSTDNWSSVLSTRLRIIRLIILNTKSEEQIDAIGRLSRQIFSLALRAMGRSSGDEDAVKDAVTLIQDMMSNKKIISIRERELCLILAHVVNLMQSTDDKGTVSAKIFDSCFAMVSFMLQRFSKQLYQCIPNVINCLALILEHCLYGNIQEIEIIDRGHKFGRLCELLLSHGEVYKKHILCLVVEFVEALKIDMDLIRRDSLSPAIYCLLDLLQQHETMQLNSMLDDMGRAVLRTVHENYKKQHVYKGQ